MQELISVIVPAYNVEPFLLQCLDSIQNQTYPNLEILVLDDGSTDQTPAIADACAKKDPRIRVIHQKNQGLVKTRNKGIALAKGSFLAFVDGDDTVRPDLYERLLQNARTYHADISHCGVSFCYPDGKKELHYGTGKIKVQNHEEGLKDLLQGTLIEPGLWNKLYRAELVKDSCLDETIQNNEDLLRNFVLFQRAQKSVYEDFCGYEYRQREHSMSVKSPKRRLQILQDINRARKMMVDHCEAEILPYAVQSWLGSLVTTVNELNGSQNPKEKQYCEWCREQLRKEQVHHSYLPRRQQMAAKLILLSPGLHRRVYRIYRTCQKNRI